MFPLPLLSSCSKPCGRDMQDKRNMPVFVDTHCDTPGRLLEGADLSVAGSEGHFDFIRMRQGGVDCEFFALYTPNDMPSDAALRRVMEMLAAVHDSILEAEDVRLALSATDVVENSRHGRLSIALGLENAAPLCKSLGLLKEMYRSGVRYVTLTHNGNNEICDAALASEKRWNGLSAFGRDFVKEMNSIGMMVDVSHISDEAFYDVLECSSAPVVATHSCCRALCASPRNMDDDMIRSLARAGGVVQINFYPHFLKAGCDPSVPASLPSCKTVADHIEHVIDITGSVENVGIGSDFDGIDFTPQGLEDISKMPCLLRELSGRGYTQQEVSKIAGGNFLRVWQAVDNMKKVKIHR